MMNSVRCVLRVLSPVHIGCDEVYEPMAFTLDEEAHKLIAFDPFEFFERLKNQEKDSFTAICGKGTIASILEIYQFMRSKKASGHEVGVSSEMVQHYRRTLSLSPRDSRRLEQELNRFSISRTSYSSVSQKPYVPGSAVKGALRTAYLNSRVKDEALPQGHRATGAKDLEKRLLDGGSFETDPFRLLKVSDFMPLENVKTRIGYAVNRKKKPSRFEARGPYQILEIIEPHSLFEGWISVVKPESAAHIARPLAFESILASSAAFYSEEWKREAGELRAIGAEPPPNTAQDKEFLIRLGRHSGAECLTIAGHRNIKIMQGRGERPKFSSEATTLWLAAESDRPRNNSGLISFGWAGLREASQEEIALLRDQKEERTISILAPQQTREAAFSGARQQLDTSQQATGSGKALKEIEPEVWTGAILSWRPNDQTVIAVFGSRKATGKGKGLIPGSLADKVFGKKKKTVTAKVEVKLIGRDAYKIIKIEA